MVVGSTLWHVTMLFLSDSSGNNDVKHNKAIDITRNIFFHSPGYFSLCQTIVSITKCPNRCCECVFSSQSDMLFELNYPSLNGYEQLKFIFLLVLYLSVYGVLV
jgi:hypothetical protein